MNTTRINFDLLLVIGYFRSALPMLSVIRHLSPRLRIGICFQPLNDKMESKTGEAQRKFERLCIEAGGFTYIPSSQANCRLLIVQQYQYTENFAALIRRDISAEEIWGMLTLASMGIDTHDTFIKQFGVSRLTVPDKGLARFLIDSRQAFSRYQGLEMIEVGLPFLKYPVFEKFAVDWIIAAPTLFSFHTEADKQKFLRNVLQLMNQIPQEDLIAYKSHNGNSKDYFTPRAHAKIACLIAWVPSVENLLEGLIVKLPFPIKRQFNKLLTGILHFRVMKRSVNMTELTPEADMALEAFLPNVRKGVIGGLSNTIWGALFFDCHYYNCVDDLSRGGHSELLNKSSENLLDLNMKYFGLPSCNGILSSEQKNQSISQIKERSPNLVELVRIKFEK